ncbi:MAG: hypothetical protein ACKOX6_07095 [Bdellovibrio sp.]
MKKIIFLVETGFSQRDYERFGLKKFTESGFKVAVWDLSEFKQENIEIRTDVIVKEYVRVRHYSEFKKLCSELSSQDFIIVNISLSRKTFLYWSVISKCPAKLCSIRLGVIPVGGVKLTFAVFLRRAFNAIRGPRKLVDFFVQKFISKFIYIRDIDFYLTAGEMAIPRAVSSDKIIRGTSLDFNLFLDNPDKGKRDFIVFIDEFEPFHPDYIRMGVKTIEAETYYLELNKFFEFIENKWSLPVVIAAHPLADLKKYEAYFRGRSFFKGKTVELIRDSSVVVSHTSTAVQMSMLYNRPLVLIYTADMLERYKASVIQQYKEYGFKLFNISDINEWSKINPKVDEELYARYIREYVKVDGVPSLNCWDIFIKKLFGKNP